MKNKCHYITIGLFTLNEPELETSLYLQKCLYDNRHPLKMAENYVINISTTCVSQSLPSPIMDSRQGICPSNDVYYLVLNTHMFPITMNTNGSVTWRGISLLDLGKALKMSKIVGKIKIHLFHGQVFNLPEE